LRSFQESPSRESSFDGGSPSRGGFRVRPLSLRESLPFNSSVRYQNDLVGRVPPGKLSGWENRFEKELLPIRYDLPGKAPLTGSNPGFSCRGGPFQTRNCFHRVTDPGRGTSLSGGFHEWCLFRWNSHDRGGIASLRVGSFRWDINLSWTSIGIRFVDFESNSWNCFRTKRTKYQFRTPSRRISVMRRVSQVGNFKRADLRRFR